MRRAILSLLTGGAALASGGCASDDLYYPYGYGAAPYGDYAYAGQTWRERRPYEGELVGPGVEKLDPWLSETPEGRAIVTLGFQDAARGEVSDETADRANIWFRFYADGDRDMRITDPEIRTALVAAAAPYLR